MGFRSDGKWFSSPASRWCLAEGLSRGETTLEFVSSVHAEWAIRRHWGGSARFEGEKGGGRKEAPKGFSSIASAALTCHSCQTGVYAYLHSLPRGRLRGEMEDL